MIQNEKKRVVFRVDADYARGLGHLSRMMTLAHVFKEHNYICVFLVRLNKVAIQMIAKNKFPYIYYSADYSEEEIIMTYFQNHEKGDLWINDIVSLDFHAITFLRKYAIPIVCFDTVGKGAHGADLVINPIVGTWKTSEQSTTVSHALNGPHYAIMPQTKIGFSRKQKARRKINIGVTVGGSDTYGASVKIAQLLSQVKRRDVHVTFFVGPLFLYEQALHSVLKEFPVSCAMKRSVPCLLKELSSMDMVICGGGQTLFEVCALGIPALALANEPHEESTIKYFSQNGACINIGSMHTYIDAESLCAFIYNFSPKTGVIKQLKHKAQKLVDGKGTLRCFYACEELLRKKVQVHKYD